MATVNDNSVTSDSSSDIDLHMSFEISSFEEEHEEHQQDIVPYRFEPEATDLSESDGSSEDEVDDQHRLENTDWYNFPYLLFVTHVIKLIKYIYKLYNFTAYACRKKIIVSTLLKTFGH